MLQILLVDDEASECRGVRFLIDKFKFPLAVSEASNGKLALEHVRKHHVDILFTDIQMPYMDGLELARQVHLLYPEIKTIIFSAYGEFEYAKKALQANVVNYLLKPIEVDEFKNVMQAVIDECMKSRQYAEHPDLVEQVNCIIRSDYDKNIGLDYISGKVNLSPAYLSALYKQETGVNITKRLSDYRLNIAKELLMNTNLKITQIAKQCGYDNSSYFDRIFKNQCGVTPKQYRERKP